MKQFAGGEFKVRGRSARGKGGKGGRRRRFTPPPKVARPQTFDLIVLDPPTRTKSRWGVVDIVNDYAGVFKPAVLCLNGRGRILCTNHYSGLNEAEWHDALRRCAAKAGRPLASVEAVRPDGPDDIDFVPQPHCAPMLHVALVRLAPEATE